MASGGQLGKKYGKRNAGLLPLAQHRVDLCFAISEEAHLILWGSVFPT